MTKVPMGCDRSSGVTSFRRSANTSVLPTIYSNQEETDTTVVMRFRHAATIGFKNAVIRTHNTDIFVILLFYAQAIKLTVYLDTELEKPWQLFNLSVLVR